MAINYEQQDLLIRLIELPDPPALPHRGYKYTYPGDSRRKDEIKRDLGTAYVEHRRQDAGQDISCVVSVRRQLLKLVKCA